MHSTRSLYILFAACLLVLFAISKVDAGYSQINSYLTDRVSSDDVGSNMAAASMWLQQLDGKRSWFSSSPTSDLKKFTALRKVIEDSNCGAEVYEIKRENEEAVGLHKLVDNGQVSRRVDKVMRDIFREHAKKCHEFRLVTYQARAGKLGAQLARVKNIAREVMSADSSFLPWNERNSFYNPASLFFKYVYRTPTLKSFANENIAYEALVSNAKQDPDFKYAHKIPNARTGKGAVDREKLKQLAYKHLIDPCLNFVSQLGRDIFEPALFDSVDYLKDRFSVNRQDESFFLGWSYYMICKAFISEETAVYDTLAKSADKNLWPLYN